MEHNVSVILYFVSAYRKALIGMMHLADELFADSRLQCAADSASQGLGPMLHRQEIASPTQENIPSPDRIQFIPTERFA